MSLLRELFSESKSVSMMRVMSLLCCITAIVLALIGINKPQPDYEGLTLLCSAFLGAAFAGKVFQKSVETKKALASK